MEDSKLPQQGTLKTNDRLARAKQYIVAAIFGLFVAVVSLGASLGFVLGMKSAEKDMDNTLQEFIDTKEYSQIYNEQYEGLKGSENFYEEASKLRSYRHAIEILKISKNEKLKSEYEEQEKRADVYSTNGLTTAGIALVGAGIATAFYAASENEKNKKLKEENEERERNMA